MQFTVRNYRTGDFPTLWRLDQDCFPPGIAYTQFELKTYIRRTNAFTLVAESEDGSSQSSSESPDVGPEVKKILGFIVAERDRNGGHIITIDVRPAARRHKLGSVLLGNAEERLRLWNCSRVVLETAVDNQVAIAFYKRHGYSVIKVAPRYYSNGVDALVLEKSLLSSLPSDNVQK